MYLILEDWEVQPKFIEWVRDTFPTEEGAYKTQIGEKIFQLWDSKNRTLVHTKGQVGRSKGKPLPLHIING